MAWVGNWVGVSEWRVVKGLTNTVQGVGTAAQDAIVQVSTTAQDAIVQVSTTAQTVLRQTGNEISSLSAATVCTAAFLATAAVSTWLAQSVQHVCDQEGTEGICVFEKAVLISTLAATLITGIATARMGLSATRRYFNTPLPAAFMAQPLPPPAPAPPPQPPTSVAQPAPPPAQVRRPHRMTLAM